MEGIFSRGDVHCKANMMIQKRAARHMATAVWWTDGDTTATYLYLLNGCQNHKPCSVDIPYIVDFPLGKFIKITLSKPMFVTSGYQKTSRATFRKIRMWTVFIGVCKQRENSPIFRGKWVEKGI